MTPGVAALVAMVALLPLLGFAVLTVRQVKANNRQADSVAEIEATVTEVRGITRVHAALTVERWWANAVVAVAGMGFSSELVTAALGTDLEQTYADSVAETDRLLSTSVLVDLTDEIDQARGLVAWGASDDGDVIAAYTAIDAKLEGRATDALRRLARLSGESPDTSDLTRDVATLEVAVAMREDVATIVTSSFSIRFLGPERRRDDVDGLLAALTAYRVHLDRLHVLADGDEALEAALSELADDPKVDELLAAASAVGREAVLRGDDWLMAQQFSFATFDPATETDRFLGSIAAIESHVRLVDRIVSDVSDAASLLGTDAAARRTETLLLYGGVLLMSLLAALLAAGWIARPLRRMADVVVAMRAGSLDGKVAVAGPREIRSAAEALNEATAQLKLAEDQALALASEDLANPILAEPAPGALGASLHTAVRRLAASLTEREEFRQRLAHEAAHDGLTGLANRAASVNELTSALARVRRAHSALAVLFVDLDGFKPVNDRVGHTAGDRVLRTIAHRLGSSVREGDHVGRLGGDQFVVVAEPVADAEEALRLADRLAEAIAAPITIGSAVINLSASIGVAIAGPSGLDADEVLRDADLAVYQAKSTGGGRIELCDESLREQLKHRATIEQSLRQAIADDELSMHYQAITDARTGQAVSLEALVRWIRPDGQVVGPDEFIPIAERSDLIIEVDRWVLRTVTRQMAAWAEHPRLGRLSVSINLSARHLGAPTLMHDVLGSIAGAGIDPSKVILEITESALLGDLDRAARRLAELRRHGIRVAIDDFGTGYTSLSHLRRLPVDVLKIDRSFVSNLDRIDDRSLVKLIVETGHLLGVSVTAEGVETLEQADILAALGSDHLQGYRFSRPLPPAALEESIRTSLSAAT